MTIGTGIPLLRETTNGPILGFIDTHPLSEYSLGPTDIQGGLAPIRKWLGIPYAQAERFQRPILPKRWDDPRTAYEFGPAFPQNVSPFDMMYKDRKGWLNRQKLGQSEDAFHVNVFAPHADYQHMPVLVWIHGGNLNSGSANFPIYDPSGLVRQQESLGRSIIVVTVNYRVGCFGWLAMPDLTEVNGHVGNFGLHDCISAFEWVKANISRFGGNPDDVTAIGESAGAFLISALLNSGRRLFDRAILESGNPMLMAMYPEPHYEFRSQLMESIRPEVGAEGASAAKCAAVLRELSTGQMLSLTTKYFYPGQWGLTRDPAEVGWCKPLWHYVEDQQMDPWIRSIIIGINADEGTFFNARAQWWKDDHLVSHLKRRRLFREEDRSSLSDLYRPINPEHDKLPLLELPSSLFYHDVSYLAPMLHFADRYSQARRKGDIEPVPIYMYHFESLPKRLMKNYEEYGILHTGEIPFVFNVASLWDDDEECEDGQTAVCVGSMWTRFACGEAPWPQFTTTKGEIVHIRGGGSCHMGNAYAIRPRYREYWNIQERRKHSRARAS